MSKSVNLIMGQILSLPPKESRMALTLFIQKIPLSDDLMRDIHGTVSMSRPELDSTVRGYLDCKRNTIHLAYRYASAGEHGKAAHLYEAVHEYGKAADSYTKAGNKVYAETAMDKEFCLKYFETWVSRNTSLVLNLIKEGKIDEAMELVYP